MHNFSQNSEQSAISLSFLFFSSHLPSLFFSFSYSSPLIHSFVLLGAYL
jgi:hypothetical protein